SAAGLLRELRGGDDDVFGTLAFAKQRDARAKAGHVDALVIHGRRDVDVDAAMRSLGRVIERLLDGGEVVRTGGAAAALGIDFYMDVLCEGGCAGEQDQRKELAHEKRVRASWAAGNGVAVTQARGQCCDLSTSAASARASVEMTESRRETETGRALWHGLRCYTESWLGGLCWKSMGESIHGEYERRRAAFAGEFDRMSARSSSLTLMLLGAVVVFVYLVWQGFSHVEQAWWALAPLVVAVGLVPALLRVRAASQRAMRLLYVYERGLGRVDGSKPQSGHTGEAFHEDGHLYERDLNILGADSIFGMLATTRTAVGQRALARLLLHGPDAGAVRARQAAVRELAPMLDLRERVALLGRSAFEELPAESFDRWLDTPRGGLAVWMRWVLIALTLAWMALVVAALLHRADYDTLPRNVGALLAVQGAFALWQRPRVMAEI